MVMRWLSFFFTNGIYVLVASRFHFSNNYFFIKKNLIQEEIEAMFGIKTFYKRCMNGFTRTVFEKERESKAEMDILTSSHGSKNWGKVCMLKIKAEVTGVNLSYLICRLSGGQ